MSEDHLAEDQIPLTDQERSLLDRFSLSAAEEPFSLEGRLLEQLSVRDATWVAKSWARMRAIRSRFVCCALQDVDLTDASFEDVTFERCTFIRCRYPDARFARCRFIDCRLSQGLSRRSQIVDCRFEDTHVEGILFDQAHIERLTIEGGSLSQVRFSEALISGLEWKNVHATSIRLTLCKGGPLVLVGCVVDGLSLLGGEYSRVHVAGGSVSGLALVESRCDALLLDGISQLSRLKLNGCRLTMLAIVSCAEAYELYAYRSEIAELEIAKCRMTGWITECKVGPGSRVEDAVLISFFWDDTFADGLTLARVIFEEAICARRAHFRGLKLDGVRYAAGIDLVLDDAVFEQSDRFLGGLRG